MNLEMLERFIAPLKRRVMQTVSRALISAVANDAKGIQQMQALLLADELHSNIDRLQNYGFTSVPQAGAEGIFLSVGGSREHGVLIVVDDKRYRLKNLANGEVALYSDEGDKIHLKRGNIIEINSQNEINLIATTKATVTAPTILATASTKIEATAPLIKATASTKIEASAPTVEVTAIVKVEMVTPLLSVSGVISCSGIATGGATPTPGNAVINGNLTATGNVEDTNGSMAEMRSIYNGHTHVDSMSGTTSGPSAPMV